MEVTVIDEAIEFTTVSQNFYVNRGVGKSGKAMVV